jgi:broad specificity phosphatase PhoE
LCPVTHEDGVTVWYVRHGENPANLTGELTCKAVDYPLTKRGVEQAVDVAAELASRLADGPGAAAIYSSPLLRAFQTAQIIAARLGMPYTVLEELRELNVGELEGRPDQETWDTFLGTAYAWQAGDHDRAFPGGEDYHQVTARLTTALRSTLGHPPGSRVLVVAHDGLLRAALPAICPGTPAPATSLPLCGIAELAIRPAGDDAVTATLLTWPGA